MANFVSKLTNSLGITDTEGGNRAIGAMDTGLNSANKQLDRDTSQGMSLLKDAASGRDLNTNLNNYNSGVTGINNQLSDVAKRYANEYNAGSAQNVQNYYNPMSDYIMSNTQQRMQGSAGDALQSSAATKSTSSALAQQAGNLWTQAFQNAMANSGNNLNVAQGVGSNIGMQAGMLQNTLNNNNQPTVDYLTLQNDKAMQRYAGNLAATKVKGEQAGKNNGILASIF